MTRQVFDLSQEGIAASRQRNLDNILTRQKERAPQQPEPEPQTLRQPQRLTPGASTQEPPQEPSQEPPQAEQPEINPATGRPFPKISPALQAHIAARMKEAQEIKPLTTEIVHPEGPTVPLDPPTYTPRKDTDTAIAELPSGYVFYEFKELYVGKFRLPHFAKLHEAYVSQSYAYLLEAVSDVLGTSHPNWQEKPLAFHLTIPDFYWVLYFLRLNQIKTSLTHRTKCNNPEHLLAVEQGKKAPESLQITMQVTRSNIHTKYLGSAPDMSQYQFEHFELKPALMIDVMEALAQPDYEDNADLKYMCRAASLIRIKGEPDAPLARRIEFMETLDYDELLKIGEFEKAATSYGPDEYVLVTCPECGHQRRSKITLDARSFLPI